MEEILEYSWARYSAFEDFDPLSWIAQPQNQLKAKKNSTGSSRGGGT